MWRRLGWIAILGIGVIVGSVVVFYCIVFAMVGLPCILTPVTELTRVDAGNNRLVIFYVETCWEVSREVFYEVQENGQTVIPRTSLGNRLPVDYSFKVVSAENESVVAVYTPELPDYKVIFVIVDFRTREAWDTNKGSQEKAKGLELYQRLKQANPDLPEPVELSR
jgi:hypothetical protein